jgi:hypothetical protein
VAGLPANVVAVAAVDVVAVVAAGGLIGVVVEDLRLRMAALMAGAGVGRGLMMEARRSSWC